MKPGKIKILWIKNNNDDDDDNTNKHISRLHCPIMQRVTIY